MNTSSQMMRPPDDGIMGEPFFATLQCQLVSCVQTNQLSEDRYRRIHRPFRIVGTFTEDGKTIIITQIKMLCSQTSPPLGQQAGHVKHRRA
jgi:hypothetical protein